MPALPVSVLAGVSLVLGASFLAAQPPSTDPVLGERLVEGFATPETLWVRNGRGAVVAFALKGGARRVVAEQGMIDLALDRGRPLALRAAGSGYEVVDLRSGRSVSPPLSTKDRPIALLAGCVPTVLTAGSLHRLDQGGWRERTLSERVDGAPQMQVLASGSGAIYLGLNRGEWGGGLRRIDPATGAVTDVRRIDGGRCDGPLGKECDPVTGIVPDPADADCVLSSVGLSHFFAHGRILRVCGTKVEVVFSRAIPEQGDTAARPSTWPFFGLAAAPGGWTAVSRGRLFRSSRGQVAEAPLPRFAPWNGLQAAFVDRDLIVLGTDVNWGQSLSGRTPLLVPITR